MTGAPIAVGARRIDAGRGIATGRRRFEPPHRGGLVPGRRSSGERVVAGLVPRGCRRHAQQHGGEVSTWISPKRVSR